jgi:hypothetical protein
MSYDDSTWRIAYRRIGSIKGKTYSWQHAWRLGWAALRFGYSVSDTVAPSSRHAHVTLVHERTSN